MESNLSGELIFISLGKVYSRQATESVNCENSSVSFVMKFCPTSSVVKNPASAHIFLNRSGCRGFVLCASAIDFLVQEFQFEGVNVVINKLAGSNKGSDCPDTTGLSVLA